MRILLPIHLFCVARGMCTSLTPQIFEDFMLCPNDWPRIHWATRQINWKSWEMQRFHKMNRSKKLRSGRERAFTRVCLKNKALRSFKVVGGYLIFWHLRVMPSHDHTLSFHHNMAQSDPGTGADVSSGSAGCRGYQCLKTNGLSSLFFRFDMSCCVFWNRK